MKKFILGAMLLSTSLSALAQQVDVITYTDSAVVVDLLKACDFKNKICDLSPYGISAKITASGNTNSAGMYTAIQVVSDVPIKQIDYKCDYSGSYWYCGKWNGPNFTGLEYKSTNVQNQVFEGNGVMSINANPDYHHVYTKLYFYNGIPTFLNGGLISAANMLRAAYKGVLRNLENFRTEIAKSHRGHLDRLNNALKDGINLTEAKDAKTGKPLYSVVDWRVQENARLIVVFGTVLNELLTDYDDVARLKTSIDAMRTLVNQLRDSYGWNRGLAGSVSKASSSLLEVVRLELQELASIKMAMGSGEFKVYLDLLNITRNLQAKVDASRSGDMKAQREIFDMLDIWNGKLWQDEMGRLMNAGPDFKNLVVPKLSMLLYSIESIADLSDQDFIIPDRTALTK